MGIIRRIHGGKEQILGSPGFDHVKNIGFYRLIGGHVELGEPSERALHREITEELGIDAKIGSLLGWSENIFTYNGETGHEVIALYDVSFRAETDIKDEYIFTDIDHSTGMETVFQARWADIADVKAGKVLVFPNIALDYI